ncbi:MAG: hypothetical protein H6577_10810 [Lewinellaceae bacterium]|nr:hypothetical protein [Saprospiraceae bacterium]MCB9338603.1 hypothetical protein [Lewinellaceae bacterium]
MKRISTHLPMATWLPAQNRTGGKVSRQLSCLPSLVFALLTFPFLAQAQISGPQSIPSITYPTIASAVTALNGAGVGVGGVTFNVAAGYTETITATIELTATGTMANPIVFQKSGAGANPVITSYTGGTGTPGTAIQDGIWRLVGSDYVTIDGIDLAENGANTTNPATMEYGYAMYKASATDGCQNNTIKNCTITLNRVNNAAGSGPSVDGSRGIDVVNAIPTAATTALTVTAASGANSNNKFYGNIIQNCNIGIALIGFAAATPFTLADTGNDVGGASAATGNTIKNYGGAAAATNPAAAIRTLAQYGLNISFNTINNNDGGGVNHVSTLRGIYVNTATSASATINDNGIILQSGATTSNLVGIENASGSTAAGNTINLNNNAVFADYLTATSGVFWGIYNTASAATVNINNNTVKNINYSAAGLAGSGTLYPIYNTGAATTVNANGNNVSNISRTGTTGGTTIGIYLSSGTTQVANSNTVSNMSIDGTGATSTLYGIQLTGTTVTANNNIISNLSCIKTTGTSALYGIYNISSPTNENYNGNQVSDLTHAGTGIAYGIYTFTATGVRTVSNNQVYNITSGGTTVIGINQTSSSPSIFKNKIYNIQSTSTGAPLVAGLQIGTLGTSGIANVYNNLIGDIKAPNATSASAAAPSVRGINITTTTTTTTLNLSYNTVYLNANSSGTLFSTAALFATSSATGTTANLVLKNNIFTNTSTAISTGLTVAYQRSSNALNNYDAASNRNLYYAGTPSATNVIFYDGTTAQQTLANFKALVAPREANSITENPPFISTTGSSADFLHINPAIATQIESGGAPVAGITDDYDGNTRNAGTPDIGADEGAFTLLDIAGPSISYTLLGIACTTGDVTLSNVTITDASGVPTTGGLVPRIYYRKNAGAWFSKPGTLSSGTGLNGIWSFTIVVADMGGVSVGDLVSYYVIGQDIVAPPNISSNPAGVLATDVNTVTTPPTPNSYTIQFLSGTKTVGVGGDYTTLTAAASAYNSSCVTGPVVFSLIDADYSTSETFPIIFNQNSGASATNTLTIRPATGVTASITANAASTVALGILGNYIIVDGSNNGSSSRDLTISNTSATTPSVVLIGSIGTIPITNVTLKNTILINGATTSTALIVSDGTTGGSPGYFNNITIQNNSVQKAYIGVYCNAAVATGNGSGLTITGNDLNTSGVNAIRYVGLYVQGVDGSTLSNNNIGNFDTGSAELDRGIWIATSTVNCTISGNNISGLNYAGTSVYAPIGINLTPNVSNANIDIIDNTITNLTSSGTVASIGITVSFATQGVTIRRNKISNIKNTNATGYGAYGIQLASTSTAANISVQNNFIWDLAGNGSSTLANNAHGIYISAGAGYNIYYNSVSLATNQVSASGLPSAITVTSAITTAGGLNIRNNIFSNTMTVGTERYAFYSGAANTVYAAINYNDYWTTGPNLGFLVANQANLAAWQAATGQDANSLNVEPIFNSVIDLHLNTALNPSLNGAATPIAGITQDIDGNTRNVSTPDMGGDEFDPSGPCTGTPTPGSTVSNLNNICPGISFTLALSMTPVGTGITYQWQSSPDNVTYANIGGATNSSYTTTQPASTWYRCVVTCTNSSQSANSTPLQVINKPVFECYCTPPYTAAGACITNVTMGTINNTTLNNCAVPSYTQYPYGNFNANFETGQVYPISVTTGESAIVSVWIDFNGNGVYEASEWTQVYTTGTTNTVNITIPGAATVGLTGMRVRSRLSGNTNGSGDACTSFGSGEGEDYVINIVLSAACTGTPSPGNTLASPAMVCSGGTSALSLQNIVSGSGITYQWQSSPDNVTYSNIPSATSSTYTATVTSATWYKCLVTCTNSSMSATSTPVQVTLSPVYTCYCVSNATNTADTKIDSVFFNTIVTGSLAATCETYTNYTSLNTNVTKGSSYSIRIRNGSCSGNHYEAYVGVYIDYNQNGLYTDPGELAYSFGPTTALNSIPIGNITIPATATAGITGMRVVLTEGAAVPPPCGTYSYGETEDYAITIVESGACSGTPAPGNTTATVNPVCIGGTTTLGFSGLVTGAGLTYQWQSSPDNVTYSDISGATSPTYVATVTADTYYKVVVTCSGNPGTSTPLQVTVITDACQCNTYCTASSTTFGCTGDEFISNVTFNTINNSSLCSAGANGYTSYTNLSTTIATNTSYALNVTNGGPFTGDQCSAWFDWNGNGLFTDVGEEFILSSGDNISWTTNVAVPPGATLGSTRMRVRITYTSGMAPCGESSYGETEDYCVSIISGCTPPTVSAPTVTQPTCGTPTGTIVVNATGTGTLEYSIDDGATYQASSTFSGLAAGSYSIKVRLVSTPSCMAAYSGNPVVLVAATGCCPATLAVNSNPILDGTYQASMDITSNGTVPSTGNVIFGAFNTVELQANFEVTLGGVFQIILTGCTP